MKFPWNRRAEPPPPQPVYLLQCLYRHLTETAGNRDHPGNRNLPMELLLRYDQLWQAAGTTTRRTEWERVILASLPLVHSIQTRLAAAPGTVGQTTAWQWRARLAHWNPDPTLSAELHREIRQTRNPYQVAEVVDIIGKLPPEPRPGNEPELHPDRAPAIGHDLLIRFLSRASTPDRLADNIHLLRVFSHHQADREQLDRDVMVALARGQLPLDADTAGLLRQMYGKNRKIQPERTSSEPATSDDQPTLSSATFSQRFIRQSPHESFVPIRESCLWSARQQILARTLHLMEKSPADITPEHARLLVDITHRAPYEWEEALVVSVGRFLENASLPEAHRRSVYAVLAPRLSEKTKEIFWKKNLGCLVETPPGRPPAETGMTAALAASLSRHTLVHHLREPSVREQLPPVVIPDILRRLSTGIGEVAPWKETPTKAIVRDLLSRLSPQVRQEPHHVQLQQLVTPVFLSDPDWERTLRTLPVLSPDRQEQEEIKLLWFHLRRDAAARMQNVSDPSGGEHCIILDEPFQNYHDPVIFHYLPPHPGETGQTHFGRILRTLAVHAVVQPERYLPYFRKTLPFLSTAELLRQMERRELRTAWRHSPEVARDLMDELEKRLPQTPDADRLRQCRQIIHQESLQQGRPESRPGPSTNRSAATSPLSGHPTSRQLSRKTGWEY